MAELALTGLVGVLGVVAGVFVERLAQRVGQLRYEAGPMVLEIFGLRGPDTDARIRSLPPDIRRLTGGKPGGGPLEAPPYVTYVASIELFNEKELRTGLRDVAIVFRGRSGTEVETTPKISREPVEVINLPSREWIRLDLFGEVGAAKMSELANCDTVEFRGRFPNGKEFVKPIPIDDRDHPPGRTKWGTPA